MNAQEAVILCRYVAACCPQQYFDDLTPDAWADALADVPLADAKQATLTLARQQVFIAPAEVITETKRIRATRVKAAAHPVPPPELDGDPAAAAAWLRAAWKRIGDGEVLADDQRGQLEHRNIAGVLAAAAPRRMQ